MTVGNNKTDKPSGDDLWQVRGEDGRVFGPATLASLKAWARDGRLSPGHMVSADGRDWRPITSLDSLGMHWVAEVSPGTFYGPVHREALEELKRDGSLAADVPLFTRAQQALEQSYLSAENKEMSGRLEALRRDFAARATELEKQAGNAVAEVEQLRGQINSKELEFEAERQEQRAALARRQAEMSKLEARCAALARQQESAVRHDADRHSLAARLADLEQQLASADARLAAARAESEDQARQERQARRDAEKMLLEERAAHAERQQELQRINEAARAMRVRLESLRKLLQQATAALGSDDPWAAVAKTIEEGVTVTVEETPPPRTGISLNAIEEQAQREIRRLGKGNKMFRGK